MVLEFKICIIIIINIICKQFDIDCSGFDISKKYCNKEYINICSGSFAVGGTFGWQLNIEVD